MRLDHYIICLEDSYHLIVLWQIPIILLFIWYNTNTLQMSLRFLTIYTCLLSGRVSTWKYLEQSYLGENSAGICLQESYLLQNHD